MSYSEKYWSDRIPKGTPPRVEAAIKQVYSSYPADCLPQGLCDPMYIMNTICLELGAGDGKGRFFGTVGEGQE